MQSEQQDRIRLEECIVDKRIGQVLESAEWETAQDQFRRVESGKKIGQA